MSKNTEETTAEETTAAAEVLASAEVRARQALPRFQTETALLVGQKDDATSVQVVKAIDALRSTLAKAASRCAESGTLSTSQKSKAGERKSSLKGAKSSGEDSVPMAIQATVTLFGKVAKETGGEIDRIRLDSESALAIRIQDWIRGF